MTIDLATARAIAHMLFPSREMPSDAPPRTAGAGDGLLDGCRINKVPLLSLDSRVPELSAFYEGARFQDAYALERALWSRLHLEYVAVQRAFADADVRMVMIKSAGIAPSLPYKSDNLDVLVALRDAERARTALLALGYVELRNVEEPKKFLFRRFHAGTTACAIHLHESVGWGTGFMLDADLLAQAQPAMDDESIVIPSPEDGLLITMAHAFYEDKRVSLGDLWKVMSILRGGELDWDQIYRQVAHRGWREGLCTCILIWSRLEKALYGDHSFPPSVVQSAQRQAPAYCREYLRGRLSQMPTFPFALSFRFSKRHYYRKVYSDRALTVRSKMVDAARHSWAGVARRLPFRVQRSMLISLSGIDGCGKTTHARALVKAFAECDIRSTYVWSRGGSSKLTDFIVRLVKRFLPARDGLDTTSDTRIAKVKRKGLWLKKPVLRNGWTLLVLIDSLLHYWAKVLLPMLAGRVVIADRYVHDALVELAVSAEREEIAESLMASIVRFLSPKPDLAYLLDVSPLIALARKPEETLGYLESQIRVYHRMARRGELCIVDAEADQEVVVDKITHKVLSAYFRRWPGAASSKRPSGDG